MNRRDFIHNLSASVISSSLFGLSTQANAQKTKLSCITSDKINTRKLILIELKGGNDGLNTLIPFNDPSYYDSRPKIAIKPNDVLSLNTSVGMHPSLKKLLGIWKANQLAWIQGVGYKNPNRSHFRAIEIWDSATVDENVEHIGWVNQLLHNKIKGIAVNTYLGPLYGHGLSSVRINTPEQLIRLGENIISSSASSNNASLTHVIEVQNSVDQLAEMFITRLSNVPKPQKKFPKGPFGSDLLTVYTLIASGLDVPSFKVSLGGFDTHTNQLAKHQKKLGLLADGLSILKDNLASIDLWDSTLIMSYSEFGRRLNENSGKGTDHGSAAAHFVMGGKVKGGIYGKHPSLRQLDSRGDLIYTVDFRDVYATIADKWWGLGLRDCIGTSINFL